MKKFRAVVILNLPNEASEDVVKGFLTDVICDYLMEDGHDHPDNSLSDVVVEELK